MMQLSNEGAGAPASPSSPGSDPGGASRTPTGAAREKPVKVLPCPRCESMNTKFCYYNNYSVTQPRHFCRQCQRYWTAGGTLRNVPVGGGSRKKNRPHGHARPGEPYSQRSPGATSQSFTAGPFGGQQPGPFGFQQQQHEIVLPGFSLPAQYVAHQPYGLDQLSQLSPGVYNSVLNKPPQHDTDSNLHAMFGNNPASAGAPSSIHPGAGYFPGSFQPDHTVKPEFWPVGNNYQASRLESPSSSMLLNLGLDGHRPVPVQWDQADMKPTTVRNGSSPLHDSSIEEEGSTPSNGFSKSGYEEGDAVSSMWHSLHDMDNLHLSVKW